MLCDLVEIVDYDDLVVKCLFWW